jgi:hypothetical protein
VTVEEDALISAGAKKLGISKSEYARRMVVNGKIEERRDSAYSVSLAFQLQRVGVNLNQLTRVANTTGDLPESLARVCGQIETLLDRVMRME